MDKNQKGFWIGEKDLCDDPEFLEETQSEFQQTNLLEQLGNSKQIDHIEGSRRDFLKFLGFGLGAATIAAGCDIPVKRAIPYVVKPEEIVPGVATYYASSFVDRGDYCSILVKTREGRPIKIEGNDLSTVTYGGTSARTQASVLSLYDVDRIRKPAKKNPSSNQFESMDWSQLDDEILTTLNNATGVRLLTNTIISPTFHRVLKEFGEAYNSTKIVTYDPVSYAAILQANEMCYGDRVIPDYHFDKADIIVSFNADFLASWISPIEYAHDYAKRRKVSDIHNPELSRHIQIESHMSMTGSNADNRILVKPSEQTAAVVFLYNQLTGENLPEGPLNEKAKKSLRSIASQLLSNPSKSLILSGNNKIEEQILINAINEHLQNRGEAITFERASLQKQGSEDELAELIADMNNGLVDFLIVHESNPVYDSPYAESFVAALQNVNTKISLCYKMSETSELCEYIAPVHHFLESWGDAEPKRGLISMIQPSIRPLFDTRQAELSMLSWMKSELLDLDDEQPYLAYLKNNWEENYFPFQNSFTSFQPFWDSTLHDGVFTTEVHAPTNGFNANPRSMINSPVFDQGSELEISFYEPVNIGNGQYSNNPWLQEMPDPVNRCNWGNYLAVPLSFDGVRRFIGFNDLKDGDLVDLTVGDQTIRVPVIQQFGQMAGTVALALGYGRTGGGFAANGIGVDVNEFVNLQQNGLYQYFATNVSVSRKKGKEKDFSCVQYHHTMGVKAADKKTGEIINADEAATLYATYGIARQGPQGGLTRRSIIRTAHVDHLEESIEGLIHEREHHEELNQNTLYPFEKYSEEHYRQGHHWGMHIDLNACTGCGACTIACMAENNVPVVGKHQVHRHQEMSWIRIDRYFYGDVENPNTVYQPMMCQHCDNAPCENVCPVSATNHSSEGINQMAYNRCIGTRYCANNCPYKVRRFNWLDYTTADIFPANQRAINGEEIPFGADNLTRLVLNPDVTVRTRGVMEKCSFCVQRIQEGKLTAKTEGRKLRDADVKTACQTACPTGAITFGDQNNPNGELKAKFNSEMNYEVLEEINTRPSVMYSMRITNKDESIDV